MLSPHAILERLGSRLKLLTSGVSDLPFRQRTLRATIDWSYRMLSPAEQMLFKEASVFSGGATIETMEKVCACGDEGIDVFETLSSLVDKSLLWRDEKAQGAARYFMLESMREYGLELLSTAGAEKEVRSAHARHFLDLAESTELRLRGPNQRQAFDSLEEDHDNLDAAIEWFLAEGAAEEGLRLCGALGQFYEVRGYLVEGADQLERALAVPVGTSGARAGADKALRAARGKALRAAAGVARAQGRYDDCLRLLDQGEDECRAAGDAAGLLAAQYERGLCHHRLGRHDKAVSCYEAVLRGVGSRDMYMRALAEFGIGTVKAVAGDRDGAWTFFERCKAEFSRCGDDRHLARAIGNMLMASYRAGDFEKALEACNEAMEVQRRVDDLGLAITLKNNIGNLCVLLGKFEQGRAAYEDLLGLSVRLGNRRWTCYAHAGLADCSLGLGDVETAIAHGEAAVEIAKRLDTGLELGVSRRVLGEAYLRGGRAQEAYEELEKSIPLIEKADDPAETERARGSFERAQAALRS